MGSRHTRCSHETQQYVMVMGGDGLVGLYYATDPPGILGDDFDIFSAPNGTHYILTDVNPAFSAVDAHNMSTWSVYIQQLAPNLTTTVASTTTEIRPPPMMATATSSSNHKNILLLIADDLGRDLLSSYGNPGPLQTRHLDALAASGTRFDLAFASTAACSGSRTTLYTGLHTHNNGCYGLVHDKNGFQTHPDIETAPRLFNHLGYRTAILGKVHTTLVVFLSDNGPPFLNSKTTLYDAGVRLPLLVRMPGQIQSRPPSQSQTQTQTRAPAGLVIDQHMVSWVDVLPSLLDWAGHADRQPDQCVALSTAGLRAPWAAHTRPV
ncbi:alkaline-phosphatase-like protein [Coniella lustricola]|uniref:Alkaline-phosphatase-like protein n=1 Tax=Coniella lustricola TaxID=2025994 RepID=A0A2T2ZW09_9PEZI|nr:alkaline-phosphatase-like protein [Coniella lustricola]